MAYSKDQQRNEESLLKVPPLFPLASHWAELESHGHPVSQSGDQGCCDWLSLGQSFNFGRILESFGKLLNARSYPQRPSSIGLAGLLALEF